MPHSLAPPPPSTDSLRIHTHVASSLLTTTAATGHVAEYGFNPMPTFGPSGRSSLDLPLAARLGYGDAGAGREVSRSHAFTTTSVSFGVPLDEGTAAGTAAGRGGCVLGGCVVQVAGSVLVGSFEACSLPCASVTGQAAVNATCLASL